jgi:hypothetical protein
MSKMKKCIPIVVFLLFIATGISKAEPTPTVQYLMDTPVSMFDFGIYKLNKYFYSIRDIFTFLKHKPLSATVDYSYDQNRIIISFWYADNENGLKDYDIKKLISDRIKGIKAYCFNLDETGKPLSDESGRVSRFFIHPGYEIKNRPKKIWKELEEITEIHVNLSLGTDLFKCKSPLIGNKVYWENPESKP